jgi:thioredoxin reductase (NADPH)
MAKFRAQAERFGARLIDVDIDRVDFSSRPFRIWARGIEYRGQAVIVATGASALWLGLDSETRLRGRGVSACATCDGFFFKDREIAVVGGGDTAFEEATYLTRFATKVHLLHRRDTFRASKIMVDRAIAHPKIEIHPNVAVEEVIGAEKVRGVKLKDTQTGDLSDLDIEGLFIAIGYEPNTAAFHDWLEVDEKGYLVVRDETHSKIDGVFIAGDVHDHRYRQAVTAAADGCKAAIDAERWLEAHGITEAATATACLAVWHSGAEACGPPPAAPAGVAAGRAAVDGAGCSAAPSPTSTRSRRSAAVRRSAASWSSSSHTGRRSRSSSSRSSSRASSG